MGDLAVARRLESLIADEPRRASADDFGPYHLARGRDGSRADEETGRAVVRCDNPQRRGNPLSLSGIKCIAQRFEALQGRGADIRRSRLSV